MYFSRFDIVKYIKFFKKSVNIAKLYYIYSRWFNTVKYSIFNSVQFSEVRYIFSKDSINLLYASGHCSGRKLNSRNHEWPLQWPVKQAGIAIRA